MRILISSNAPWVPSGYGVQARLLVNYLKKHHEIAFLSNFGLTGGNFVLDNVLYLPADNSYGNKTIKYTVGKLQPDLVLSLADWFVFDFNEWNIPGLPWANWTPIDSDLHKMCKKMTDFTINCTNIIPMSKFGHDQINKFTDTPKTMPIVPHALDPSALGIMDKKEAKKMHNLPEDAFVIGFVMANQAAQENRKAYDLQIEAVSKFIKKNPDLNVVLYFHTVFNNSFQGRELVPLLMQNDIDLNKAIFTSLEKLFLFPFQNEMVTLYNAFDVLMNASSGEGFGVPIIEAQACGVPVITHNFTAMPEITFNGYLVKSNKTSSVTIEGFGKRYMPSVPDMVKGLQYILDNPDPEKNEIISQYVRETFSIQKVGQQWLDIIEGMGADTQVAKGVGL